MTLPTNFPPPLPPGVSEESLFRTLFMASTDALIVAGTDGRIVLANPAAAALLRYSVDELTHRNVDDLVPQSIRHKHAAYRHSYERNPSPRPMGTRMELQAERGDGTEVMVEIALSPLQGFGLPYVVAAIRDIAAYPRMKQALRRARYSEHLAQWGRMAVDLRETQVLLDQIPVAAAGALQLEAAVLFLLEPSRTEFRVAAHSGVRCLGLQRGDRIANRADTPAGHALTQQEPVITEDFAAETRYQVPAAYLSCGFVSSMSVALWDRERAIGVLSVYAAQPAPFGDDEVRFLQSLCNMLTTTLQRVQSEEALKHAQKLESVGQLTGGIAHDFNNLLTVIQGNLQVLEELPEVGTDPFAQDLVGAALRASQRGAELTGKLLAFSRRQVLQPEPVDVRAMLQSLADMLRRTLDQRIVIEVQVPADCPPVLADPGQLESALLNIAINARDAMPEGGRLVFDAQPCAALPSEARSGLDDPSAPVGGFVAIRVRDTGMGMTEDVKERVFEPFFTTKEVGRGTGLGLSTVYGFVKQSKGAIQIDSAPGKGCGVTMYIPRPWHSQQQLEDAAGPSLHVPPGLKVLLVEDDAEVRTVVQRYLGMLACAVTTALNAEQAVQTLSARPPEDGFDLLLSDIALGSGMRGTELARLAQDRFPCMAVLLMSGFSSDLIDADRQAPPSWELLRKPYSRAELAAAIARVLGPGAVPR